MRSVGKRWARPASVGHRGRVCFSAWCYLTRLAKRAVVGFLRPLQNPAGGNRRSSRRPENFALCRLPFGGIRFVIPAQIPCCGARFFFGCGSSRQRFVRNPEGQISASASVLKASCRSSIAVPFARPCLRLARFCQRKSPTVARRCEQPHRTPFFLTSNWHLTFRSVHSYREGDVRTLPM